MKLTQRAIVNKARKVKLVILDADGVLTDGTIIYGRSRTGDFELARFDVHDGFGIRRAIKKGLPISIITGRDSSLFERRARDLGISEVYLDAENKLPAYEKVKRRHKLNDEEIASMGDDVLDLVILERVGLSGATRTAVPEVKKSVHFVSKLDGGRGAVREFLDFILRAQGKIS
jgi:3-deoxy-D-manno-octulosonate 8-phosphate phosphatase (KDO 8-P phosphatase)